MSSRSPSFFWQAVLILLPVGVLAIVGLVSLHQDERAAEADAHTRALDDAYSLALTLRVSVHEELNRFRALQNTWMIAVRTASQPDARSLSGEFPDPELAADIQRWERDYPGLKLADLALPTGDILTDGRQIYPPDSTPLPRPPKWFVDLTPPQKIQWEALRSALNAGEMNTRRAAFQAGQISNDARDAALYLTLPPEQLQPGYRRLPAESGLTFQELALCRMLSAPNARLSAELLDLLWNQTLDHATFLTPKLMALTAGLTNRADPGLREKFVWMQYLWDRQCRTTDALTPLRQLPNLTAWKSLSPWHWTDHDRTLAIFSPTTFADSRMFNPDKTGVNLPSRGYEVWFTPQPVIEAVFQRALRDNRSLIPGYAAATITVAGKPLVGPDRILGAGATLLGGVSPDAGTYNVLDTVPFELNYYLTSREQMLSVERRRMKLFSALILGSLIAALAGLLAAHRAFRRQRQLNELKSNFVSSVSHELRAPIAAVRLMAENLEGGKIPGADRRREYYQFIVQECRRLSSLIENVLDFSRIEQGRKQYEFEPTDLLNLTRTTVKLMAPCALEKGVTLRLETEVAQELTVDGRALQQALVNLLDNAIKHSARGETVTVGMELAPTPERRSVTGLNLPPGSSTPSSNPPSPSVIRLWVADHGPGIPAAEHEKIFERFYRLGSELRRETQGIGIGLSIVQHILTAHGGRVLVASQPGHGSRFTLELPVEKAASGNAEKRKPETKAE